MSTIDKYISIKIKYLYMVHKLVYREKMKEIQSYLEDREIS